MSYYDVIYIKGNPSSGTALQHEEINNSIIEIIKEYNYKVIDSEYKNVKHGQIPKSKVYIGFSRGSRYFNRLDNSSLKISIGGISGSKIHLFKNVDDNILLGDISESSMLAHFVISNEDKIKIRLLIKSFLNSL